MSWYGIASYGLAGLVYGAIALILLVSRPGGRSAIWLIAAAGLSSLWGMGIALLALIGTLPAPVFAVLDTGHVVIWILAMLSFLGGAAGVQLRRSRRWLGLIATAVAFAIVAATIIAPPGVSTASADFIFPGLVLLAVLGFLSVEQVFRNAREEQRRAFGMLCLAVGGIFTINLFMYSHAVLLGGVNQTVWELRGLLNAVLAPLIVIAVKRQPEWERELFVSRQMAFYTTSLLGIGGYLMAMGVLAYAIRALGGQWGAWLQLLFLVTAFALLLAVLHSSDLRSRLKVFLVKHFYRNKYDYREEWLRLTESLARTGDAQEVSRSALQGIAAIVGSRDADLWLTRDGRHYEWIASLDPQAAPRAPFAADDVIVRFLLSRGWVIDSEEYAREPEHYGHAFGTPHDGVLPASSLVVPLDFHGALQGLVVLRKPDAVGTLNFEDHDILKTAGKQAATLLAQSVAQEQLAETRQFEAMNKLSHILDA
jgi:putative PEP-CTERM system histidine kinase